MLAILQFCFSPDRGRDGLLPRLVCHFFAALLFTEGALAQPQADDWHPLPVPESWRQLPKGDLAPLKGYSWYRCRVQIPEQWRDEELVLHVESLDDARATYVNGVSVGATGTFPPRYRSGLGEPGRYIVPANILRFGKINTVAIRVYQEDPRPNFRVAPPVVVNEKSRQGIRLQGPWQYRPGDNKEWATPTIDIPAHADAQANGEAEAGIYAKVDQIDDVERYMSLRQGDVDPLTPAEATSRFVVPADLQIQLVLSEPEVVQPLFLTWDARGRLWVMEYRQYPDPAGLKMISRDVYLRTVYDRVPKAPPNHVRGRDRISIHEDTNGDGVYDRHKVFVDGLNIATSFAIGRGGVWVTNPPYLLFFPDLDGDDVPDGDPEVHLEGFGLEDSHSVINSLRFGPDGWLYAAQGSTVSANVRRPGSTESAVRTMGQQIWRYHPERRRFEVFAEGGGNTFGVEIDAKGRVFSGHNGGDTRGFHYVQGSYSRKGFNKHGSLSNPFAFGFFEPMKHHSAARFTHNFVLYEAETLPQRYRGRLFGIEPLQGQVVMSSFEPHRSSFQTEDLSRPIKTDDPWFRPVDIKVGPDGCIYIADMYEQRIDHSSHYAGRIDRTNGRVYRVTPKDLSAAAQFDYARLDTTELINLLAHPNKWHRHQAQILLGDRKDDALTAKLVGRLRVSKGQLALELLWALHNSGGLGEMRARQLLHHSDSYVRAWTVRLLCDNGIHSSATAAQLEALALDEPAIEVRKQLASSAKRLPAQVALPIIRNLIRHAADSEDIHQPLLIWWAIEAHVDDEQGGLPESLLGDSTVWDQPLVSDHLLSRMMKRYLLSGTRKGLVGAANLLRTAPSDAHRQQLLRTFEEAYSGRSLGDIPGELAEAIRASGGGSVALRLRLGDPEAISLAVARIADDAWDHDERTQLIEILGDLGRPEFTSMLINLALSPSEPALSASALHSLKSFRNEDIGRSVVQNWEELHASVKLDAELLLASRPTWTRLLLERVEAGQLSKQTISESAVRQMLLHRDSRITQLLQKHWGTLAGATTEEMRGEMSRIRSIVQQAGGNPKRGKPIFMRQCGKCHRLFDEGGDIGPDLTAFQREDVERGLVNIVNPSLEIREGFENHLVLTNDGRVVSGFLADQDSQVVVVRGLDGRNEVIPRGEIESQRTLPVSVMPEGTLRGLSDKQLRDFFAYFRSAQPVNY